MTFTRLAPEHLFHPISNEVDARSLVGFGTLYHEQPLAVGRHVVRIGPSVSIKSV